MNLFDYLFSSNGDEAMHLGEGGERVRRALWDENGDAPKKDRARVIRNRALDAKAKAHDKKGWW